LAERTVPKQFNDAVSAVVGVCIVGRVFRNACLKRIEYVIPKVRCFCCLCDAFLNVTYYDLDTEVFKRKRAWEKLKKGNIITNIDRINRLS
jgi:hypothetical protein